jgi:Fic family protein
MDINNIIPHLNREINHKKRLIEKDPEYDLMVANRHNTFLANQANIFSWYIEHPQLRTQIFQKSRTKSQVRKNLASMNSIAEKNSKNAWSFLRQQRPVLKNLDHNLLINLGGIIEDMNQGYRNCRVSLGLADYTPPNPLRVMDHLDSTFEEIKNITSPIEAAIYLHLRIAGIQPFIDGNKRTARMLQNRILYEARLPPAIIHPSEREHYITLLESALAGHRDENKPRMYPFFTYMGSKVNEQLEKLIDNNKYLTT